MAQLSQKENWSRGQVYWAKTLLTRADQSYASSIKTLQVYFHFGALPMSQSVGTKTRTHWAKSMVALSVVQFQGSPVRWKHF